MCGRYALYGPKSRDNVHPMDEWLDESFDFPPHYNAAPTQSMPIVRVDAKGGRECKALRWGLVPSWARDAAIGSKLINARGETLAEKPSFRSAFRKRRCLVPMAGFYEWQTTPAGKIPHFIRVLNAQVFAVAGLYEWWPGKNGDPIESFTIVTTVANEFMAEVHARMPVILAPVAYGAWLDVGPWRLQEVDRSCEPGHRELAGIAQAICVGRNDAVCRESARQQCQERRSGSGRSGTAWVW